jgi:uncharacterized protein (TIGR02452 family)
MSFDYEFTPSRGPDRGECQRHGREVVAILGEGSYLTPSGRRVDVRDAVRRAVEGTVDHRAEDSIPLPTNHAGGASRPSVRVVNGTSLAVARTFAARGIEPVVLNFASAKNPGGGFLNGARAQEESLARSSALFATIERSSMYSFHRQQRDAIYTSWMIHSPRVPVFRDDETGELLEEPYACAFLTAPAPNAGVVLERDPSRAAEVERVMRERCDRALAIMAYHGHKHLVLGAWGCGVFGNDPEIVADQFSRALGFTSSGAFAGAFDEVVFAVLDWSPERRFVRPFAERFAS